MLRPLALSALLVACSPPANAQQPQPPQDPPPAAPTAQAATTSTGQPALTIYNGGFAVVREHLQLQLDEGTNQVSVAGMTSTLEPDSVILRDPTGQRAISILEQSYRNDPVSQERLLSMFEGKVIRFEVHQGDAVSIIEGKVIRSGYVPGPSTGYDRYGNWIAPTPQGQPVIEVGGAMRFSLPGLPLFPSLGDDTVLQPTLGWTLATDTAGPLAAELAYVTDGFTWEADYNAVEEEGASKLDIVGWITMQNHSGKTFREAKIKLMAGDVSKVEEEDGRRAGMARKLGYAMAASEGGPAVTEKAFDEFHLYTVSRPVTLRHAESKQVEFVRATGVPEKRLYVYDGAAPDGRPGMDWGNADFRFAGDWGTQGHKKVWVVREIKNDEASGLGLPLPKGKVRFYTRDKDGQLEFTGENLIDHTPKDETVRVYTGNAFDLVGERKRTDFRIQDDQDWLDESFEITLRNHKTEAVEFRVVEHLYRWTNWDIRQPSNTFLKTDAQTIEFRIPLKPDEERVITYTVHYTW